MHFAQIFVVLMTVFLLGLVAPSTAFAATYYLDCSSGLDSNSGTSANTAWQSMQKVNASSFQAGDELLLKTDCTWDTGLQDGTISNSSGLRLQSSGTGAQPIRLAKYGTGAPPVLTNSYSATKFARIIKVEGSNWQIEDLTIKNSIEFGIEVASTATGTFIHNLDISNVGTGVNVLGNATKITNCTIHDTNMIVATANNGDDDYGSTGIVIASSNNEIAYNKLYNNLSLSPDYGVDGAAVEFFTYDTISSISGTSIHHNWMENNAVVTEMGSTNNGVVQNITFSQNVLLNNGVLATLHTDQTWGAQLSNIAFENNTVYEDKAAWEYSSERGNPMLLWFSGGANHNTVSFKNNIIASLQGTQIANLDTFTHTNNIWYLPNLALPFALHSTESAADPRFVSVATQDFSVQASSPALDVGVDLGYSTDYLGQVVPSGAGFDLGAYEYAASESACQKANINQQGLVDILDYSILISNFFQSPPQNPRADINGDAVVNILDYSLLVQYLFKPCP